MTDVAMMTDANEVQEPPSAVDEVCIKIDELIALASYLKRVVKPMIKKTNKKRARSTDPDKKVRNGFQAPVKLDPKLAEFIKRGFPDRNITDIVPRTEITQLMTTYIKTNDLQIPENRKNFTCDKNLATMFGVEEGYVTNWFEMQKLMRPLMTTYKPENTTDDVEKADTSNTTAVKEESDLKTVSKPTNKRIKKPSA